MRAGLLIPSSNIVIEDVLRGPHAPDVAFHIARLGVTLVSTDAASARQFALDQMVAAMALLADMRPHALAWAGTSAAWLGLDHDRNLVGRLADRFGLPATTTTLAVIDRLAQDGADTIGLVTPFTADLGQAIEANFATAGIAITAARHLGAADSRSMAEIDTATIEAAIRATSLSNPKAILCLCTNFRGADVASRLRLSLGLPVLDSVLITLDAVVKMCRETAPPPK